MDKYSFGDIILLRFPFTNGQSFKKRPALVINDTNDGDILVCRITSQIYKTRFDVRVENWEKSGLKLPSVVRVHKIATLEKDMIELAMGKIDALTKDKVEQKFKKLIR